MIPIAEYAPDRSKFDPTASSNLVNVLPHVNSWGPFPAFVPLSAATSDRPQGTHLAYVRNGQYLQFVGTQDALYVLNPGTLVWDNISKAGGYSTPATSRWSFADYGSWVLASNGIDPIQYIDISGALGTFDDLSPDAPIANHVSVVGDFVVAMNLNTDEQSVQWSGLNQPQFWTPRQRSSDFQVFPDGGEIMGSCGFERGAVIFQENCIREMTLALTSPLVATFSKTVEAHGAVAPQSIVSTGSGIFYLALDGFYRYGTPPTPIGVERIDETFLADIALAELYQVFGSADPVRKIVYWAYRSKGNPIEYSYDKVLCYHYGIDKWSLLNPGTIMTGLVRATTPGYTLDSLTALGYTLDELPFSLDSRAWAAGAPSLAAFDMNYKMGFFSGKPLAAKLSTGAVELSKGRRTFVSGWRPLCDAPKIKGRVGALDRAGGVTNWKPVYPTNRTGLIPARASGRFHAFEIDIPADQDWSHCHGVDPVGKAEGQQ
ncbi:hypothetical protein ACFOLL_04395 [Falsochrobactrum ovis]|uniref:Phage stabilization protein n=1 Tax=Falsochrobactrum ovis TaxID=1293442 RepID=A0A364JW34_9HYPH|nr:hypothetical protein [Falsochrobactrum ovis]RAK29149.1 hypothetical protein C7374_105200 [Falsochrobactrum ovis]